MNTHDIDIELPPLPSPFGIVDPMGSGEKIYTLKDMGDYARAYALAAIEADRKRRGEPVAWRWSESNGERWFAWTTDWSHHDRAVEMGCLIEYAFPQPAEPEQHATLNLQPSSSMQPVATAFFTEQGEVAYTGIYDRTLKALEAVKTTRMGISSGSIDLYAAPQAAESVKVPSDAEIGQILKEVLHNSRYGVHQWELWLEFASALFTRYGGGTP